MKRETIQNLLTGAGVPEDRQKDVIDSIMAENGKDVEAEKAKTSAKEKELETANATITGLREAAKKFDGKDPEKLQQEIDTLKSKYDTDIKEERQKAENAVRGVALKEALTNAGLLGPYQDYFITQTGGIEKFAFVDGKAVGIDELLKPLRESNPAFFKAEEKPKQSWSMSHEGRTETDGQNSRKEEANQAFRDLFRKEQ